MIAKKITLNELRNIVKEMIESESTAYNFIIKNEKGELTLDVDRMADLIFQHHDFAHDDDHIVNEEHVMDYLQGLIDDINAIYGNDIMMYSSMTLKDLIKDFRQYIEHYVLDKLVDDGPDWGEYSDHLRDERKYGGPWVS